MYNASSPTTLTDTAVTFASDSPFRKLWICTCKGKQQHAEAWLLIPPPISSEAKSCTYYSHCHGKTQIDHF